LLDPIDAALPDIEMELEYGMELMMDGYAEIASRGGRQVPYQISARPGSWEDALLRTVVASPDC
jgi:hypothetical protein